VVRHLYPLGREKTTAQSEDADKEAVVRAGGPMTRRSGEKMMLEMSGTLWCVVVWWSCCEGENLLGS
jgi:hypothetical protein